MSRKIIIILSLLFLTGCSTLNDKIISPPETRIEIDPRLLISCKDLVFPATPMTYEGILTNNKINTLIYIDCKNKHNASIVVLKKFSNQP